MASSRWILGLIVDKVIEVMRIARDDIQRPPAATVEGGTRYLAGVYRRGDRIVMVLDLDALLTDREQGSLSELSRALPAPSGLVVPPATGPAERRGRDG